MYVDREINVPIYCTCLVTLCVQLGLQISCPSDGCQSLVVGSVVDCRNGTRTKTAVTDACCVPLAESLNLQTGQRESARTNQTVEHSRSGNIVLYSSLATTHCKHEQETLTVKSTSPARLATELVPFKLLVPFPLSIQKF